MEIDIIGIISYYGSMYLQQKTTRTVIARSEATKKSRKSGLPRSLQSLAMTTKETACPAACEHGDIKNDRYAPLLKQAKELSKSRLREIKNSQEKYWTPEKRAQKAKIINNNKPWLKSTGPKTIEGRQRASQNAYKHGFRSKDYGRICRLLRLQKSYVKQVRAQTLENIRELQVLYAKQKLMSTLDQKAKHIYQLLQDAGVEVSRHEVKRMMKEVTGHGEDVFITQPDMPLSAEQDKALDDIVARRVKGEPLYRIFGKREFWGLEFIVTPDTLDPRPDTETLIEAALKFARAHPKNKNAVIASEAKQSRNSLKAPCPQAGGRDDQATFRILDLGTGTGCIPIALLSELPNATAVAVDYSYEAALVARENAARNKMSSRFSIIQGDWMSALKPESFDLIVSNPPYIPNPDIENLAKEVKNHDPFLSLSGGNDGLDCYKKIISDLKINLNASNRAFLEIGFGQLEDITRLVDESNLCLCDSEADIAGIPRVVEISSGDK